MGHGPHAAGVLRIVPCLVVMLLGPSIASSASLAPDISSSCIPGSAWEAVTGAATLYPIDVWVWALDNLGLSLLLKNETQAPTLFIPLNSVTQNESIADPLRAGLRRHYTRLFLTSPESVGIMLLHWFQDNTTLLQPFINGSDARILTVSIDELQMEATLSSSAVTPSSQSRPILDTLESCRGATIHIIDSAFVMSAPPVVDLAQVPGLEGLCWRSRTVVDNQGAITVGAAYIDKLRIYPMMLGLLDGRFPDMPGTTFLLRPAANITLLVPNPDSVSSMLQQLEMVPASEPERVATVFGQYMIPGGYCEGGILGAGKVQPISGLATGTDMGYTFRPADEKGQVYITMASTGKVLKGYFGNPACYTMALVVNDTFMRWDRWEDIPPSRLDPWPTVDQEALLGLDPQCRPGDVLIAGKLESTEAPTPASSDPEDGGLSGGAIAGIVIGTLVGVALVGLLVWIFLLPSRPWLPADHGLTEGEEGGSSSDSRSIKSLGAQLLQPFRRVSAPPSSHHYFLPATEFEFDVDPESGERKLLGRGRFGEVYSGRLRNGELMAIKVLLGGDQTEAAQLVMEKRLLREIEILKTCRSKYIVSFMAMGTDPVSGNTLLFMERALGGDVWSGLRAKRLDWHRQGWRIALDVARGLVYLSIRKIVHNDLKTSNILLDDYGSAKITDVGLARMLPATFTDPLYNRQREGGTFNWCSPEVILGLRTTAQSDMYSYGVVLWELVTSEIPKRGKMRPIRVPEECPEAVVNLMEACWSAEPKSRPRAEEAVRILSSLYETPEGAGARSS
ncbi:hypothetical protein ACKKBF_B33675 [Auxenochlorella protothecoides x Auxenochlorella symbiontica]